MLASWFVKIYVFFSKRKALLFAVMSAFIIFSVFLTLKLDFKEDIADFLPSGEKYSEVKNIVSTASGNSKIFIFFNPQTPLIMKTARLNVWIFLQKNY